ncbi:MAG: hypothetical protein A2147_10820 [Chloroflexi bacterium RBG_16_57_8]|nr:MAG: hypothetical protein A2147_10820 [Chloroflexi bacterium RBG_16_57_8]
MAIHRAVQESHGRDAYANETLAWTLLSSYDNDQSQKQGRQYKAKLALLPSVDHVGDRKCKPEFKICSWRTNDAKSDLYYKEFVDLCRKVIAASSQR